MEKMSNQTTMTEFILRGFSDIRELQILHSGIFLVVYLAGLMTNILVITCVAFDHRLHTPMYFFLINLSIIDLGSISVTIPKSMLNSLMNTRVISYTGCVMQVFFFFLFTTTDLALLTFMAYDRYIAICQPLLYERVMNRRACVQMATGAWISSIVHSSLHTWNTFKLPFCHSNVINQFFCEVPQILKLTCSDSYLSELGFIAFGVLIVVNCFVFIIVSYVEIFKVVLRLPTEQARHKAFSTCLPHLTVVSLLLFPGVSVYLKPTSSSTSNQDLLMGVLYAVVPPVMNPLIYSMRNKDIRIALKKLIVWRLFNNS